MPSAAPNPESQGHGEVPSEVNNCCFGWSEVLITIWMLQHQIGKCTFNMFQHVSTCFNMFQPELDSWCCWNFVDSPGISWIRIPIRPSDSFMKLHSGPRWSVKGGVCNQYQQCHRYQLLTLVEKISMTPGVLVAIRTINITKGLDILFTILGV